jgi:bis(5'-nucleosyl)-tetraphosphatase (symmetrical)
MATYAIGDLQGCYGALQKLLANIGFNSANDRLWFVGDIVNRGPQSLQCLRYVRDLGERAVVVLGNHDLHLLCAAYGCAPLRKSDTLQAILEAPDRDALLDWLRHRPMLHIEGELLLVHAGLLPQWTAMKAKQLGEEVECELHSSGFRKFLGQMYGNLPDTWSDTLSGYERLRVIVNAMTRMRACTPAGRMEFSHKGEAGNIPDGYLPWFEVPGRASSDHTVIFGHWSALDLKMGVNILGIDTGCVWGGALTAIRLEDRRLFQVRCAGRADRFESS